MGTASGDEMGLSRTRTATSCDSLLDENWGCFTIFVTGTSVKFLVSGTLNPLASYSPNRTFKRLKHHFMIYKSNLKK